MPAAVAINLRRIGIDVRDPQQPRSGSSRAASASASRSREPFTSALKRSSLDESTSALGVAQTSMVLKFVRQVRGRGLGVIFVTHNVRHARIVGDRFTVLNRGKTLGTFAKSEIQLDQLQTMMAGGKELQELSAELGGTV